MQAIQITDGRTSLWQWDTGVRIKVYGCTDVDQMHFVTPAGVISKELVKNECDVPDAALQTAGLLKMYAYDLTENGGVTRCDFMLLVKERPKPADYIDPPDEYDNLEELAKRVAPLIPGGGGEPVTPEQIQKAVDNYLAENPVQVEETDPTVPGWAKAKQKPTYTAEEVGAQPKGNYALKSEIPSVPVQSVNGKTGTIVLNASDVGALPADAEIVDTTARDGVEANEKAVKELSEEMVKTINGVKPDENGNIQIEGGAGVEVDTTLTESGKAADAKVTGDRLATLSKEIESSKYEEKKVVMTEKNIINGHFIQPDGKMTGVVVDNYVCTDYVDIPFVVSKSITVRCAIVGNCSLAWYDSDKKFIGSISGKTAADYGLTAQTALQDVTLTLPGNAMYLRFGATTQQGAYTEPSQLYITGTVMAGVDAYINSTKSAVSDSNVLVIGDSISTDYYGEYEKWVTALCNIGFFSAGKVDNESIHATGFVARYNDNVTTFLQRINAIENPGKYDLVIVFGGINDFIQNIPFGEAGGDETAYFIPAVDAFFESLTTKFVGARLAVLLPLRTRFNNANTEGKRETEYGDYIKTVAEEYSLPVLDLTRQSGFYPYKTAFRDRWTLTEYSGGDGITGDGVHPNEEYERRFLAPMIRSFLQSVM